MWSQELCLESTWPFVVVGNQSICLLYVRTSVPISHLLTLYSLGSVKLHEGWLTGRLEVPPVEASWGAVERPAGHGLGCGHAEYGEAAGWAHAGAALAGMDPGGLGRHLRQEGGRVPHGHTLMVLAV